MTYTSTVVLMKEPEGGYTVVVPALPGCITYGETVPEALSMAEEAMECYIESLLQHGELVPAEGPTLCIETEDLTEGFLFRVTAAVGEELAAAA